MRNGLLLLAVFATSLLGGCALGGSPTNDGGGTGAAGGAAGSAGASTSVAASSSGSGGFAGAAGFGGATGSSTLLACDDAGACGNTGRGCVACAVDGPCADTYHICFNTDDCSTYGACFEMCADDAACVAACDQQFPAGKDAYAAFFHCVICDQCKASCGPKKLCAAP